MTTDSSGLWRPDNSHNPAGLTEEEKAVVGEAIAYFKNAWAQSSVDILREKSEILGRCAIKIGVAAEDWI